jgi:adenosylcobinamide-GDP ribazoletransferase
MRLGDRRREMSEEPDAGRLHMWGRFGAALSFLTVYRLPFCAAGEILAPRELAATFSFFPLVGLTLGLSLAVPAHLFHRFVPLPLLAVWITTLLALLTRGLHLDGLADLVDGVGGGCTPERRLEIMKDSRSGAFGVLALVLAVAIKVTAIYALLLAGAWTPFFLAPMLSRSMMVFAAYKMPYARPNGLGKPFLENMSPVSLYAVGMFSLGASIALSFKFFWLYIPAGLLVVWLMRRLCMKWLGGMTGDVLGAVNEVAEVVLFSLAACLH